MFDPSLFTKRLESNICILTQAKNLCGYGLASVTSGGEQGIYVQINQRIQACIIELNQLVEEIRASKTKPKPEHEQVDTAVLRFLTNEEQADLGQLNRAHDDLNSALSLVIRFKERLYSVGRQRRAAGDVRQD